MCGNDDFVEALWGAVADGDFDAVGVAGDSRDRAAAADAVGKGPGQCLDIAL